MQCAHLGACVLYQLHFMRHNRRMRRYIGLIDGEDGAYGIHFPDLPGCVAMGKTVEGAIANAADALRDWIEVAEGRGPAGGISHPSPWATLRMRPDVVEALRDGATAVLVPLIRITGHSTKANLSIDEGILAAIDAEAGRRGLTRSGMVEVMAREMLPKMAL